MILNNRINVRIAALAEAIEQRKMEQEAPVDDLSRGLFELGQELAGLDGQGKAELLKQLNQSSGDDTMGLDFGIEDLEKMISDFTDKN